MTDEEEVIFTPRHVLPRLRFYKVDCAACGGLHPTWWKSTPPPSCEDRRARRGGA